MANLALDLREAAQMYPDRAAVRLDDAVFSYARLDELSARGAAVPMNPLLKAREVAHYLGDSGARLVLAWETAAGEAQAGAEAAGASAVIIDGAALAEVGGWPLSPEVARRA